ncbi:vacuolar cation channel [Histoplasma capsulatum]|uniref:Vacuolar cation channel n=1 Tax=Ajellomyces capsulatus TaxID=5037 RepID=A0A8A1M2C6_AJECA|nr:vacuolar cation channel [Histoplasma capsulatum]
MGPFITKPRGESCRQITRNSYLCADHRHRAHRELYEGRRLLPVRRNEALPPALPAKEVTKVALRLKYQIEQVIPCELDEDSVTKANSNILTKAVIQTTREAGEMYQVPLARLAVPGRQRPLHLH